MNEYLNEIKPFINDIIHQTINESIHWKRINPSTFYWSKDVSTGRVKTTIQKVEGPKGVYFRFEVKEVELDDELILVDTREFDEIQPIIGDLYNTVKGYAYQNRNKRDDILRELLES